MSDPLQAADFEPHVGKTFHFEGADHSLPLDRVEIGAPAAPPHRRPFILIFRGPKPGAVLAEGLYRCEADDGAAFELHVAPIHTPQPDRQEYQSVFN